MRAIDYIIVEIPENYINFRKGYRVNTTIEKVSAINRIGKVISAPEHTELEVGDDVVVHHNIVRLRKNGNGKTLPPDYLIKDNLYFVPVTEAFMYRRNGEWYSMSPYCFVKPIKYQQEETDGWLRGTMSAMSHKGYVKNTGVLDIPNKEQLENGLSKGDTILFSDYSEYEFIIDDELFYKMSTKDIIGKLNDRIK